MFMFLCLASQDICLDCVQLKQTVSAQKGNAFSTTKENNHKQVSADAVVLISN